MKKARLGSLVIGLMACLLLASCMTTAKTSATVQITYDKDAEYASQAGFAAGDIAAALFKAGAVVVDKAGEWTIAFDGIDESLGEQAYEINVSPSRRISIVGGDSTGLMYGGLEIAEQIGIGNSIETVASCSEAPYILQRGLMSHVPLDMRSPGYASPGDSGQLNIENVWNIDFWHDFFDDLARNRYNSMTLRNLSPFASMVKVEGYEDVALDDVWRTTIPFDNSYSGACTDLVRPEHYQNYEVVKTISIDEKIEFWKEVMAYAKSRAVDVYMEIGHLYTYAENGKHGIDNNSGNPVTKDYYCQSAKALISTYPDLKGLSICPGENMGWDNSSEGYMYNMRWLSDVYVPAVNEAIADSDRDFHLILWTTVADEYMDLFRDCKATMEYYGKFGGIHMYASSDPQDWIPTVSSLTGDTKIWLTARNEDCFDMRWGDIDFYKEYVMNMPKDSMAGFKTGSDGYFYGKDYSSTDPELYGNQLYTQKHWYNYMLLGRLTYDPQLSNERICSIFGNHYNFQNTYELLYKATNEAGKIIPQVQKIYFQDSSDYTWFVAGSWSHPNTFGYIDVKKWMKSSYVYPGAPVMSIEEYAVRTASGESIMTDLQTPIEAAAALKEYANDVLSLVNDIRSIEKKAKSMSLNQKDYWCQVDDNEAMSYLGLYYSEKILGSVDLRIYNETKDTTYRDSSVEHLKAASGFFSQYAHIISRNYVPQQLSRVGTFNVMEIAEYVAQDVESARTWKPKNIKTSYVAPTRVNYFSNSKEDSD